MKLWSIQPLCWYEKLLSEGIIFGEEKEIEFIKDDVDFMNAYHWMISQMESKIGKRPFGNAYPIWAWFQYENINRRKPDLRRSGFLEKGNRGVRIEFEKDEREILLSDFSLWHHPLNFWHIADDEAEDDRFDAFLKNENIDILNLNSENAPLHIKEKIENSWEKILDMNYSPEYTALPFENKSIQATFWSLSLDEIKKIDYFIAR